MTPCSGQRTRGASASRNARIRPRSRVRHRRRPAPWSYPEQRFPQRPHRRLVAFRGRTDTTTACSASSNSTPSTTTFTNPSIPAHSLAERTPFPAYGSCCLKAGIEGEGNGVRRVRPPQAPTEGSQEPEKVRQGVTALEEVLRIVSEAGAGASSTGSTAVKWRDSLEGTVSRVKRGTAASSPAPLHHFGRTGARNATTAWVKLRR